MIRFKAVFFLLLLCLSTCNCYYSYEVMEKLDDVLERVEKLEELSMRNKEDMTAAIRMLKCEEII